MLRRLREGRAPNQQEQSSQMNDVRLISTAANELRLGAPLGAPDAGDLCPS